MTAGAAHHGTPRDDLAATLALRNTPTLEPLAWPEHFSDSEQVRWRKDADAVLAYLRSSGVVDTITRTLAEHGGEMWNGTQTACCRAWRSNAEHAAHQSERVVQAVTGSATPTKEPA